LVVLVPPAEELVGSYRQRFDPSAEAGMPAHITINYPFQPSGLDQPGFEWSLQTLFAAFPAFEMRLARVERFPDVLYLAPQPVRRFQDLIQHVADRYPESPPYGGVFDQVIPHLTVADVEDPAELDPIAERFLLSTPSKLPIRMRVDTVWLMDSRTGRWTKRIPLPLLS
jgi:2'-5' RNA ligase